MKIIKFLISLDKKNIIITMLVKMLKRLSTAYLEANNPEQARILSEATYKLADSIKDVKT